jgi:hypothetical protein
MKFINNSNDMPIENKKDTTAFDKAGLLVISSKEKSYAKVVASPENPERETYYIKTHKHEPYDPWGMHSHREQYLDTVFRRVSKSTFDFYMMFLKTKNFLYMTRAQRSFIND